MQEKYIKINNLQVYEKLSNFVSDELLKGTDISAKNFWLGLEETLDELAPKNKELIKFASAYSGLTNIEIKELDKWIRKNTIEKFGPVRSLKPEMVFEISFEKIQISKRHKSGIAVRFPRITKWRKDKKINDADSLENAYELMKKIS